MNKHQLKKAINQNMCRTFVGANIQLLKGEKILLEDLISAIKRLESDKKRFTDHPIGQLQGVIELNPNGISVNWVMAADTQGNLLAASDSNFDDGILQELESKLIAVTREVVKSIDAGNELARESTQIQISADEMLQRLQSTPNARIARSVTARASGPQVTFAFAEGERQLGGNLAVPKEFTNTETITIEQCRVVRWVSDKEVKLHTESLPNDPRLLALFQKNDVCVRVQQSTHESTVLKCAAFADTTLDIDISLGLLLKSGRQVLQLSMIHDHSSIYEAAQTRLNELQIR